MVSLLGVAVHILRWGDGGGWLDRSYNLNHVADLSPVVVGVECEDCAVHGPVPAHPRIALLPGSVVTGRYFLTERKAVISEVLEAPFQLILILHTADIVTSSWKNRNIFTFSREIQWGKKTLLSSQLLSM